MSGNHLYLLKELRLVTSPLVDGSCRISIKPILTPSLSLKERVNEDR